MATCAGASVLVCMQLRSSDQHRCLSDRLRRIPVLEGALLDAMQEETASTANDFTLQVTPEQQKSLMYIWYDLQKPESPAVT